MTYQRVTGTLSANSHPGSYCGQDAYNDMFITENYGNMDISGIRLLRWGGQASSLKQRDYKDATDLITENAGMSLAVRRLTPLECSRLQGYPDSWLDLPPKEDMTDEELAEWNEIRREDARINGKTYKDVDRARMLKWYNSMIEADSNKYKALGNSICLPFWKVLAKKISATYDRDVTIGSLFDGIGGFPLVFEQINGEGTARWASEVEPYCIAVTKHHFRDA